MARIDRHATWRRVDGLQCARVLCNGAPGYPEESGASSRSSLLPAVLARAPQWSHSLIQAMEHLKTAELTALRKSLAPLVSNLEKTVNGLPEPERTSYDEAEQSVVDARRKAEAHEGLLQVN
jgi:hypothetical protein